ncbi:hypothetical protein AZI85_09250 [Bdellovibrio bacteriovorus]|uniref:Restriction endonuclease type IV Mrr domain-containing protein n=1 Tax=Bdellovibrio bacteriovorus TaxID=959 RepID=A0A150WE10_BDEBC|nr:hypothetical protein [Bdellovibrio bacteriovorus]KYG61130.1 hypothetical protein AZI85_09250 [Bdellovibrio bacteriovorus]
MRYEPAVMILLEDILSDAFEYHNQLDTFVLGCGLNSRSLAAARVKAENKAKQSKRAYSRAPKRFVVQEILSTFAVVNGANHEFIGNMIQQILNPSFKGVVSNSGVLADVQRLDEHIKHNKKIKEDEETQKAEFRRKSKEAAQFEQEKKMVDYQKQKDLLREQFLGLQGISNSQQRGFAFEKFLSNFFEVESLQPRGSFKIVGEQIDGSFIFQHNTHLLEAKWTKDPCAGAEFGPFVFKLQGKSLDTRGLFVSINGFTLESLEALKGKGTKSFICIDGSHLMMSLEPGQSLTQLLEALWRKCSETGNAYFPVGQL